MKILCKSMLVLMVLAGSWACSRDIQTVSAHGDESSWAGDTAKVTVPAQASFRVVVDKDLGSAISKEGDSFQARLRDPLIVNGRTLAPSGALVEGKVENIDHPNSSNSSDENTAMELVLTKLTTAGHSYRISTEPFKAMTGPSDEIAYEAPAKAKGLVIGNGDGTVATLAKPGADIELTANTAVNFVLKDNLELPVMATVS